MSHERSTSESDIGAAIRSSMRKGQEPSVPYARRWELGGCAPTHSLRTFPYDGIQVLSEGVARLGWAVRGTGDGIILENGPVSVWVAANRSTRGDGPPDAYLLGKEGESGARYTGNAPEVVMALLRDISSPVPPIPTNKDLQIGFPGLPDRGVTYVGSWQWGIHGEVRDDEFVCRAAVATVAAIGSKEARYDG